MSFLNSSFEQAPIHLPFLTVEREWDRQAREGCTTRYAMDMGSLISWPVIMPLQLR
jgi:hypothetical protein